VAGQPNDRVDGRRALVLEHVGACVSVACSAVRFLLLGCILQFTLVERPMQPLKILRMAASSVAPHGSLLIAATAAQYLGTVPGYRSVLSAGCMQSTPRVCECTLESHFDAVASFKNVGGPG
jgi:hypothetical protein